MLANRREKILNARSSGLFDTDVVVCARFDACGFTILATAAPKRLNGTVSKNVAHAFPGYSVCIDLLAAVRRVEMIPMRDYRVATVTVLHGGSDASAILLPIVR
jgi:hypothetical protein